MLRTFIRRVVPASALPTLKNLYRLYEYGLLRHRMSSGKRYLTIRLDTTNRCNLKCKYCYTLGEEPEKPAIMPVEMFEKLAAELFPRASMLALSCASEPTMNKNFSRYIDIAAKYEVPHLFFVTNGQLLHEDIMLSSIKAPVHEVSISIDACEKELYESIRANGSFETVIGNLERFAKLKKEHRSPYPKLSISYTIFKENADQAPCFIEKFGEHIDIFNINPLLSRKRNASVEFTRLSQEEITAVQARCLDAAKGRGIQVNANYGSVLKKPLRCPTARSYLLIRPQGDVSLCNKQVVGNLGRQSYGELVRANDRLLRAMSRGDTDYCRSRCGA